MSAVWTNARDGKCKIAIHVGTRYETRATVPGNAFTALDVAALLEATTERIPVRTPRQLRGGDLDGVGGVAWTNTAKANPLTLADAFRSDAGLPPRIQAQPEAAKPVEPVKAPESTKPVEAPAQPEAAKPVEPVNRLDNGKAPSKPVKAR